MEVDINCWLGAVENIFVKIKIDKAASQIQHSRNHLMNLLDAPINHCIVEFSVADPDNFAPEPVFKIPEPDPAWNWPNIEKFQIFVWIFIPFESW